MSKVHFVGAGPGDVELITLKGYKQPFTQAPWSIQTF